MTNFEVCRNLRAFQAPFGHIVLHNFLSYSWLDRCLGFRGGTMAKNPPAEAEDSRDMGSVPELGRSPGVGNGSLHQYSCLESSMDRGVCWATAHRDLKEWAMTEHCAQTTVCCLLQTNQITAFGSHNVVKRLTSPWQSPVSRAFFLRSWVLSWIATVPEHRYFSGSWKLR